MSVFHLSYARSFIPDEHMVWCPEQLLQCMLAHIHYMPDHWRGNANKSETRDEVAQLFQYKAVRTEETVWIDPTYLKTRKLSFYWLIYTSWTSLNQIGCHFKAQILGF